MFFLREFLPLSLQNKFLENHDLYPNVIIRSIFNFAYGSVGGEVPSNRSV